MYEVKIVKDLCYAPERLERNALGLYLPQGEGPFPLLVFFYGGGLEQGVKEDLEGMGREFAQAGVAVAAPDYRLFPEAVYPDFLLDAARSVAWVNEHADAYLRRGKLFVGGYSAGCYLSMMLAFDKQYLGAHGLDPDAFGGFVQLSGQPTTHFNVLKYSGLDPRTARIDHRAPLYFARSQGAPQLFIVSDDDMPCRLEQNQLFVKTLEHFEYAAPLRLQVVHGPGHGDFLNDAGRGHSYLFEQALPFLQEMA